jgi:hypothetical protein
MLALNSNFLKYKSKLEAKPIKPLEKNIGEKSKIDIKHTEIKNVYCLFLIALKKKYGINKIGVSFVAMAKL